MLLALLTLLNFSHATTYEVVPTIKDGYLNVRSAPSAKSEVIGKLFPEQMFRSNSDEGMGWLQVSGFTKSGLPKKVNIRNRSSYVRKTKKHPALRLAKAQPIELHTRPGIYKAACTPEKSIHCKTILKPNAEVKYLNSEWIELSRGWEFYYEIIYAQSARDNKVESGRGWAKAVHFKRKDDVMTALPTAHKPAQPRPQQTSSIF